MNLDELRHYCERKGLYTESLKDVFKHWLSHDCPVHFDIGLTVMPKKIFYKHVSARRGFKCTQAYRHPNRRETEQRLLRLVDIMNRLAFKNAYKRYGKRLDLLFAIEGDKALKDLHGHFVIAKPAHLTYVQFGKLVRRALEMSGDFEIDNPTFNPLTDPADKCYRYKMEIVDSGWTYYSSKELNAKTLENLYLP